MHCNEVRFTSDKNEAEAKIQNKGKATHSTDLEKRL